MSSWILNLGAICTALAAVGAVVFAVWHYIGLPLSRACFQAYQMFHAAYSALMDYPEMRRMLEKVHHELTPNSGHSVSDSILWIKERLSIQEERLRIFMLEFPRGQFTTRDNGEWYECNRICEHIFSHSERELLHYGWLAKVRQDLRDELIAEYGAAMNQCREFNIRTILKNGKQVYLTAYPLVSEKGEFKGFSGTVYEVTDDPQVGGAVPSPVLQRRLRRETQRIQGQEPVEEATIVVPEDSHPHI